MRQMVELDIKLKVEVQVMQSKLAPLIENGNAPTAEVHLFKWPTFR